MEQVSLTIPRPSEQRTFSVYKANNITIPEGYVVIEMDCILDFLTQCDEHLYEVKEAVYYIPSREGSAIYCCPNFWNKYDVIIKEKEKALKKLQAEQEQQEGAEQ